MDRPQGTPRQRHKDPSPSGVNAGSTTAAGVVPPPELSWQKEEGFGASAAPHTSPGSSAGSWRPRHPFKGSGRALRPSVTQACCSTPPQEPVKAGVEGRLPKTGFVHGCSPGVPLQPPQQCPQCPHHAAPAQLPSPQPSSSPLLTQASLGAQPGAASPPSPA